MKGDPDTDMVLFVWFIKGVFGFLGLGLRDLRLDASKAFLIQVT